MSIKSHIFVFASAFITILGSSCAMAATSQLYKADGVTKIQVSDVVSSINQNTILVIGELHGMGPIRDQHVEILNALRTQFEPQGYKISVGMEFLNYTDQNFVEQYKNGQLNDQEFKTAINWGAGNDFEMYKQQISFPQASKNESTIALNMPSYITRKISQNGIGSLTPDDQRLLPPNFTLGSAAYLERFRESMGGHTLPPDKELNYFTSQSMWDETMAWRTVEHMKNSSKEIFVIIVGEFHVRYGGGLPSRLAARLGAQGLNIPVKTLTQIWAEGATDAEISAEILPSTKYGPRADFISVIKP